MLVALVSGLLPTVPRYLPIFPFLNPQIVADVWHVIAILTVVSGLIADSLARVLLLGGPSRARLAIVALFMAVLAAVAMLSLAGGAAVAPSPYARLAFLCFFVCI